VHLNNKNIFSSTYRPEKDTYGIENYARDALHVMSVAGAFAYQCILTPYKSKFTVVSR